MKDDLHIINAEESVGLIFFAFISSPCKLIPSGRRQILTRNEIQKLLEVPSWIGSIFFSTWREIGI
jgi:hypothetical protein